MEAPCYATNRATEIVMLYSTASIHTLGLELNSSERDINCSYANAYKINANSTEMRSPHKVSSHYTKRPSKKVRLESLSR